MNSLTLMSKPKTSTKEEKVIITISNNNFTSPTVSDGGQTTISSTSGVTDWLFNSVSSINVRMLNNLSTSDNAAPPNWNTVPVKTVLYVCQYGIITTDLTQTINIPSVKSYTVSVWVNHRKQFYNANQNFRILVDDVQVVSPVSFSTGATTTNWAKYSGTYTPTTAGNKVMKLRWDCTSASVDTTIMITQITMESV